MSESAINTSIASQPSPETATKTQPLPGLSIRRGLLALLVVVLIGLFLVSLAIGSVNIPLDQVVTILLGGEGERATWTNIVFRFRLPKATTAILAGAALSVAGLMMQTFFRNPLASPFILGISSGASLGVAFIVMAGSTAGATLIAGIGLGGDLLLASAAGIGAGLTMLLVLLVSHRVRSTMTLLVLGVLFGYFTGSVVSLLIHFSVAERVQAYLNWTFGSFGGVTWSQMPILAGMVVVGLLMSLILAKPLNALLLGEGYARTMGVNVTYARVGIIVATALLAGAVTAFCGPIGFIGVAVPHLCRSLFSTSNHRVLVPATILMGGIVALVAALIAELPGSNAILPLNAVTAVLGAPVVIAVILRQRNLHRSFGES